MLHPEGILCCRKSNVLAGPCSRPPCCFSISGLMVGISALATTVDIVGDLAVYGTPWYVFWTIIQRGSWAVFKRLPLLFAVALPIGLAQKQPARCCLEALVAYFAYCFFLSEIIKLSGDNLGLKYPSSLTPASGITVIDGIKTLDTGIIGPLAYRQPSSPSMTASTMPRFPIGSAPSRVPRWSTSSAFLPCLPLPPSRPPSCPSHTPRPKRCATHLRASAPSAWASLCFWSEHFEPMGLHHLLYMPIYYDNLVIHDGIYATWTNLLPILSHSTRPLNELAPWAGFTATGWGKLFGLPAIAAAFYFTAKPERRAGLKVILFPPSSPRWSAASPSRFSFSLCSPIPDSFCSTPSCPPALP